jgi:hypothetical protein
MALPGFSADSSLDGRPTRPRYGWGDYENGHAGAQIVAAIAGAGAPGLAGCIENCVDRGNTMAHCAAFCRAAGGGAAGPGAGPTTADQAADHALCVGACWTWWGACVTEFAVLGYGAGLAIDAGRAVAGLFGLAGSAIGPEPCGFIRDQCISGCP